MMEQIYERMAEG